MGLDARLKLITPEEYERLKADVENYEGWFGEGYMRSCRSLNDWVVNQNPAPDEGDMILNVVGGVILVMFDVRKTIQDMFDAVLQSKKDSEVLKFLKAVTEAIEMSYEDLHDSYLVYEADW